MIKNTITKGLVAFPSGNLGGEHATWISMSNLLEQATIHNSTPPSTKISSFTDKSLYLLVWAIVALALMTGSILLLSDVFSTILIHAPLSAAPLLLIGMAFLAFQVLTRPGLLDLFKALIVSLAFILWGIDQLLPPSWVTTFLGDAVIVLYVIDAAWMMTDRLRQQWNASHRKAEKPEHKKSFSTFRLAEKIPVFLPSSTIPEAQMHIPQRVIIMPKRSTTSLKRNRLAPLPCTCASPLAPFQSSTCCKEIQQGFR